MNQKVAKLFFGYFRFYRNIDLDWLLFHKIPFAFVDCGWLMVGVWGMGWFCVTGVLQQNGKPSNNKVFRKFARRCILFCKTQTRIAFNYLKLKLNSTGRNLLHRPPPNHRTTYNNTPKIKAATTEKCHNRWHKVMHSDFHKNFIYSSTINLLPDYLSNIPVN